MLGSLGLIFSGGLLLGGLSKKINFPSLIGMIFFGIIIGPNGFGIVDKSVLMISTELRKIALIIILINAGLNLDISQLKKNGTSSILLSFLPAVCEIIGIVILGTKIFGITIIESIVIGSILAAVSPAVVVPRMLKLIKEEFGVKKGIPQMIVGAASIDDVFVIILFTNVVKLSSGSKITANEILSLPISMCFGIFIGLVMGLFLVKIYRNFQMRNSIKVIILLGMSFMIVEAENFIKISSLLSVILIGMVIYKKDNNLAKNLSSKFSKLWLGAEIILFVLVGTEININFAMKFGFSSVILVLSGLVFREIGVFLSLMKSDLNFKEKLFTMIAYTPKATVQAAIGGIPLMMGLGYGKLALTLAVVSILITAPIGAFLIDNFYKKLLLNDAVIEQ
ncbi:cation:proton antiporter [Fusobacterium sp. PH5-44]|uniref:cation:proton antiporter domain-containing protein n=1 Tax=unclassified Fusobacterium TaxID=2648384 RepID=UPI003D241D37